MELFKSIFPSQCLTHNLLIANLDLENQDNNISINEKHRHIFFLWNMNANTHLINFRQKKMSLLTNLRHFCGCLLSGY